MSAHAAPQHAPQEDRGLTPVAFTRLLQWLDDGTESNGETYLEMRRRLVFYFDRRNRLSADELADETLTRVGRTLEKDGAIATRPPARYCYVVAKFVLLEDIRREQQHATVDDQQLADDGPPPRRGAKPAEADEEAALREKRLDCLDRCLDQLKADQRAFVLDYYRDTGHDKIVRRRNLARQLGISMNALGIRACRLRGTLETCVEGCCNGS
jgi:DNA-directed RNA polymerase specialized sigma24 family protein